MIYPQNTTPLLMMLKKGEKFQENCLKKRRQMEKEQGKPKPKRR